MLVCWPTSLGCWCAGRPAWDAGVLADQPRMLGYRLDFVVGHSLPVRLRSPRVLVPQTATASSFMNKESLVLLLI
ncbi:uncharacterized [Tachysurus ichikawai]